MGSDFDEPTDSHAEPTGSVAEPTGSDAEKTGSTFIADVCRIEKVSCSELIVFRMSFNDSNFFHHSLFFTLWQRATVLSAVGSPHPIGTIAPYLGQPGGAFPRTPRNDSQPVIGSGDVPRVAADQ